MFDEKFIPKKLQYDQSERYVRFGIITSDDGDTLTHAKQASQGSFIILENNSYVHAKHVYAFIPGNSNSIVIAFNNEDNENLKKSKFFRRRAYSFRAKINFELKHQYFYRLHYAVDHLAREVIEKLTLTKVILKKNHNKSCISAPRFECIDLDVGQMKALRVILASNPDIPILIAGPFGTGKTRLLARAAYEISKDKNSHILICAHHQASVDTFVGKYFGPMKKDKGNPWDVNMIRVIPNDSYHSKTKQNYKHIFKCVHNLCSNDLLRNRIVITTLGIAQKLFFHLPERRKGFFTHILIDEGAQTREPETVSPLCLAEKNTRIIITGDHLQVC